VTACCRGTYASLGMITHQLRDAGQQSPSGTALKVRFRASHIGPKGLEQTSRESRAAGNRRLTACELSASNSPSGPRRVRDCETDPARDFHDRAKPVQERRAPPPSRAADCLRRPETACWIAWASDHGRSAGCVHFYKARPDLSRELTRV